MSYVDTVSGCKGMMPASDIACHLKTPSAQGGDAKKEERKQKAKQEAKDSKK